MPQAPLRRRSAAKTAKKKRNNPTGASVVGTYTHPDATVLLSDAPANLLDHADRQMGG